MNFSWFRQSVLPAVLVVVCLVAGIVIGFRNWGFLQAGELAAYDWTLRFRSAPSATPPPIVLITITDEDIRQLEHWPVSDAILAQVLKLLLTYEARTIGVDVYRDMVVPPGREELDALLQSHRDIITVMKFGEAAHGGIPGPSVLKGTDQIGFSDFVVDQGGMVRRGLLYLDDGNTFSSSFALLLASRYLEKEGITPQPSEINPDFLQLGSVTFRPFESSDGGYIDVDASGYQFLLNFDAEWSFPKVSLHTLLSGSANQDWFKDKIVIVGVIAEGVKDFFYTAWCGWWTNCHHISGIELQASIANQLINAAQYGLAPMKTLSDSEEHVWIIVWVFLGALMGWRVRRPWLFACLWGMGCIMIVGMAMGAAVNWGWWIPMVSPVLGWVLSAGLITAVVSHRERQDRQLLMDIFGRHAAPEVVELFWNERDQFMEDGRLRPQKQIITTLFSDLEGFTGVSEKLQPPELLGWLNAYMERMVAIIMRSGGVVDDYHGDMIKADFGAFKPEMTDKETHQDALNAVSCAWEMEKEMQKLHHEWKASQLPTVRMRVGIHTGSVVRGCLGSAKRMKYTTIGDAVNIAARLESFEKDVPGWWADQGVCRILIGDTTQQLIAQQWNTEKIGVCCLRGKEQKISVYRVLGKISTHTSEMK